ncbi:hypothetical protein ACWKWU_03995 [Chitinophaga lutea]
MTTSPKGMTTLTGVLDVLKERGYDNEFLFQKDGSVKDSGNGQVYAGSELKIIRTYRFEGESNPSDAAVLYLLEHTSGAIGYIIDAYGMYSDFDGDAFGEFIRNVPVEERDFE